MLPWALTEPAASAASAFTGKKTVPDCWDILVFLVQPINSFVYKLFNTSFKLNFPQVSCCNYQPFAMDCNLSK